MYETVFAFAIGGIVFNYLCKMNKILSRCYEATANARIAGLYRWMGFWRAPFLLELVLNSRK